LNHLNREFRESLVVLEVLEAPDFLEVLEPPDFLEAL
jgi:hypothetical protein